MRSTLLEYVVCPECHSGLSLGSDTAPVEEVVLRHHNDMSWLVTGRVPAPA